MPGGFNEDLVNGCVRPFYLRMMGSNAAHNGQSLAPAVAAVARRTTADEVLTLLRGGWREQVMGAWIAAAHGEDPVVGALLECLAASQGSFTAPPLCATAVLIAGTGAVPFLQGYEMEDRAGGWGSAGIAVAALEYLGHGSQHEQATDGDVVAFERLLGVAALIQRG